MEKIALFHPWIKSKGGAEKVILELLKMKGVKIDIFTWVYDKEKTFKEFENYDVKVISPKIAQRISRNFLLRGLFLPLSFFSKIPLKDYDKFFISTSGVGEFILFRNKIPGKTFAYVHTPLRAASKDEIDWNLKNKYRNIFSKGLYLSSVFIYKIFEKSAWKKINFIMFNSEISKQRAIDHNLIKEKKNWVVYPPIDFKEFSNQSKPQVGNFFFYGSRLNYNKRQKELVEMWNKLNPKEKLIIAGNIENKEYFNELKKLSEKNKNITLITKNTREELLNFYKTCKAVIFVPYKEDFGIVPFEVLASGKILIATDEGGYVELVKKYLQAILIPEKDIFNEEVWEKKLELMNKITPKKIFEKEVSADVFRERVLKVLKNN